MLKNHLIAHTEPKADTRNMTLIPKRIIKLKSNIKSGL